MQYKEIVLEMLEQQTQLSEQLRQQRKLLSTVEAQARELKASHNEWKETLSRARPDSNPIQISSEALEMAMWELEDRLRKQLYADAPEALSLDVAMAFIRKPTSRG